MRVLGISLGHDSSACIVENGEVTRYAQEERFSRIKVGVNGAIDSMRWCLDGKAPKDMDSVAISSGIVSSLMPHYQALFKAETSVGMPLLIKKKGFEHKAVNQIGHHDCHAGASYYTSGFEKSLIITIDGVGEETSIMVSEAAGKTIKALYMVKESGISIRGKDGVFKEHRFKNKKILSLGWFYGMVTEGLGWRLCCDEGKVMGLAPYGDPNVIPYEEMRAPMYRYYPAGYYHDNGQVYYHFEGANAYKALGEKYGRENLAAAAQKIIEDKVMRFIKRWVKRTGHKTLCVSGGVFVNVKLNQKIVESKVVDNFWVFPLATDTGCSVGAALVEYWKKTKEPYKAKRITNIYWGPEYTNDEIKRILDLAKLRYRTYNVKDVAGKLEDNKIVGWFQGKMEAGPRALGGRSILMSPLRAENKDVINAQVKFREAFRPFCPSVISEAADKYFDGGGEYMITACNVKTIDIPAVTHKDNTARPQIVKEEVNPMFHRLIKEFGELTGHPVLLNTSLNVMGEPVCMTPQQAIRCFYGVGMDLLVLGDYVLEKGIQ